MTNNFLKFTVIFLAILIFICFAFLLYGLYSKISNTEGLTSEEITSYSLNLSNKEIIKDILCVAPEYGKKIASMVFKKSLKCVNIFMNLEENPNENNKIVLDKEKDKFGIPLVKLFYKKAQDSLRTAKFFLEEF